MNTDNILAMINFAACHSEGEPSIVNQCNAAMDELAALIKAAQHSAHPTGGTLPVLKPLPTPEVNLEEIERKYSDRDGGFATFIEGWSEVGV